MGTWYNIISILSILTNTLKQYHKLPLLCRKLMKRPNAWQWGIF